MTDKAAPSGLSGYILRQAENNAWSNHRLHKACAALSPAEYFASRPSFFGSIHAHLDHIVFVDWLYMERLTGKRFLPEDVGDLLHQERDPLFEDQVKVDRALIDFCRAADAKVLASKVTFNLLNGSRYTEAVMDVLAHLFAHQIHHRGQVHDMLAATSVAPPQLDEFFMASDLPLRREELRSLGLRSAGCEPPRRRPRASGDL
jgi:uncharacterized damage-inducible protein DinB